MLRRATVGPTAVVAVLGFCGALVSITQTVTLPLLPILPGELGTSVSNVSWVATASFLSGAVANPVLGRLGDMYGKRRVMVGALALLATGCVVSAVARNVLVLIIGRAMQGCGTAVVPLGMSVAKEILPPAKRNHGIALVSATLGIGGGLGLPLSGMLLGWFGWQSVFWVNAALATIGLLAALLALPEVTSSDVERFDVVGGIWLSGCLVVVLLPLSKAASWGWTRPLPMALYAMGFAGLATWARYEQRPARPLVNVKLMRERPLLLVNGAGLLLGFGMFNNMYTAIVLLQTPTSVDHGFGTSVVIAGLVMLPGALVMMATSPVSAWITDRYDARVSLGLGALVMGVGYTTRLAMIGSLPAIAVSVGVVYAGIGIAFGAMPSATMANVPDHETGSANAIGALSRAAGAAIGSAAVAAIFSSLTVTVAGDTVPSLRAFQLPFVLSAATSIGAAALACWLPRAGPLTPTDEIVTVPGEGGSTVISRVHAKQVAARTMHED